MDSLPAVVRAQSNPDTVLPKCYSLCTSLPVEIRRMIYSFVLSEQYVELAPHLSSKRERRRDTSPSDAHVIFRGDLIPREDHPFRTVSQSLKILETCRQIYEEALPILYGENTLQIDLCPASRPFRQIPPQALKLMRHIHVSIEATAFGVLTYPGYTSYVEELTEYLYILSSVPVHRETIHIDFILVFAYEGFVKQVSSTLGLLHSFKLVTVNMKLKYRPSLNERFELWQIEDFVDQVRHTLGMPEERNINGQDCLLFKPLEHHKRSKLAESVSALDAIVNNNTNKNSSAARLFERHNYTKFISWRVNRREKIMKGKKDFLISNEGGDGFFNGCTFANGRIWIPHDHWWRKMTIGQTEPSAAKPRYAIPP